MPVDSLVYSLKEFQIHSALKLCIMASLKRQGYCEVKHLILIAKIVNVLGSVRKDY